MEAMPRNAALLDYLKTRRSVGMAFLAEPGPSPQELREIFTIGTRVPDHAKLAPWRFIVIEGEARRRAGDKLAELLKASRPDVDETSLEAERNRFLPAPLTIGVVHSPKPHPKAPELEQLLSAGAVCFNLCNAAFALGYGATWVTRWYAFDVAAQSMLGVRGGERFVGFVHIGTSTVVPEDRDRPDIDTLVTRWS
jgi:nitroreductase